MFDRLTLLHPRSCWYLSLRVSIDSTTSAAAGSLQSDVVCLHVLAQLLIKLLCIRHEGKERTRARQLVHGNLRVISQPYYSAMSPELVEMDDWLKAGHCVDPDNEMQLCAIVRGIAASAMRRIDMIADGSLRFVYPRCCVTVDGDCMS